MISIAMATYNGEKFLEKQIYSILHQTILDFEIVVCDDHSQDSTWQILERYAKNDERFHIFRNEKNLGFKKNFEKAIGLTKGDYIALCDQDDIWYPRHLEILLNNIGDNMLCIGNCDMIDKDGNLYKNRFYEDSQQYRYVFTDSIKKSCRILFSISPFIGCSMLMKKSFLAKALPIPEEIRFHDVWFSLLGCYCGMTFTHEKVIQYRMTGNNVTGVRTNQFNKWIMFKLFIKLLIFNEIPQGRIGMVQTILERVDLNDNETKFLKKSLQVLSVKGNIFTCLQNAPFYIKHCRHIFTF